MLVPAALLCALWPSSAQALPSDTPDVSAFTPNSDVFAIARSGDTTYIGGGFTELYRQTGGAAELSTSDGGVTASSPEVDGGSVHATAPDGAGGYYLGGDFSSVGGVARDRIAHVLSDGTVDPAFDPAADDTVRAIAVSGTDVYVGGDFLNIGGQARNRIAKLSAASGNAFSAWNPNANGIVNALAVSGSALYVGGQFNDAGTGAISIGGQSRNRIAKLSTTSGNAFSLFNPNANNNVLSLAVSGSDVYVGGAFINIGGVAQGRIAKLSASDGTAVAAWNPSLNSDVGALAVSGSAVYAGGGFNTVDGTARQKVAKISASSGELFSLFDPDTVDGSVNDLAVDGSSLYVAGSFTEIGGQDRNRLAKLSTTSGNAFSAWDANADGSGFAISVSGSEVYAGGSFGTVNKVERNRIAALDADGVPTDFNPNADGTVESLAVSGNDIYVGGQFNNVGGQARDRIAKLSAASGNAFSGWNAGDVAIPTFPLSIPSVKAIAVSGSDLFVGGNFEQIGGDADANYLAKLSTSTGNAFSTWSGGDGGASNQVFALAISGTDLFVGGLGGVGNANPERNHLDKLYAPTGNSFSGFNANVSSGGDVNALAVSGTDLYVGGEFTSIGGDAGREHLAQLYTVTGNSFSSFDPGEVTGGVPLTEVTAVAVTGSDVYAGGFFTEIGGQARNHFAALFADTGNAFSSFDPDMDGHVRALAADSSGVYAGGAFLSVGGRSKPSYAQFTGP